MLSDRFSRWRYRVGTRVYEMRREQSLRAARWRYRLDNLGMSTHLKTGILLLLAFLPFVVYFLIQPSNPTVVDDGTNEISNFSDPPQPPLAFPISTPTPPAPTPSIDPPASPTPTPEPSPSPTGSPSAARCANGRDDDRDGRRDFPADRGCTSRSDNTESPDPPQPAPPPAPAPAPAPAPPAPAPQPPAAAPPPSRPAACFDGDDNDGNGWTDYPADGGCSGFFDDNESGGTPSPPPPPPPTPPSPPASPSPSPTPTSAPRLALDDLAGDLLPAELRSALPDEALEPLT